MLILQSKWNQFPILRNKICAKYKDQIYLDPIPNTNTKYIWSHYKINKRIWKSVQREHTIQLNDCTLQKRSFYIGIKWKADRVDEIRLSPDVDLRLWTKQHPL